MKPLFVANWKANKTVKEAVDFAQKFGQEIANSSSAAILCVPFPYLYTLFELTDEYNFKVGAQNVSRYDNGAYTGEVTAQMLQGIASHCIVGHSERWKFFGENAQTVAQKVEKLLSNGITPILCVSDQRQLETYLSSEAIAKSVEKIIFVHEPPGAISGGKDYHPQEPERANEEVKTIKEKIGQDVVVLYGGSVNSENITGFLEQGQINGFLVGQASLSVDGFAALVSTASR
ncbi:MAG: triose-phosphate isomerase family protein [bacterium]|nr:triose-phosphate isomerase family protein [bacterium]